MTTARQSNPHRGAQIVRLALGPPLVALALLPVAGPVLAQPAPQSAAVASQLNQATAAYERGDYASALRVFRTIAEQGDANAQYNLGVMYDNGRGVPQDYAAAMSWWRRAAEGGSTRAQFNLGGMHLSGKGAPQDYTIAGQWFRKAAERGYADAQFGLATLYYNGLGVPQDYAAAASW